VIAANVADCFSSGNYLGGKEKSFDGCPCFGASELAALTVTTAARYLVKACCRHRARLPLSGTVDFNLLPGAFLHRRVA